VTPPLTVAGLVVTAVSRARAVLEEREAGLRSGSEPEDVHKSRVATRRLRSDLATLAPVLDRDRVGVVRSELRWLGGELGPVRDADVLDALVERELGRLECADPVGACGLHGRLAQDRRLAHQRLVGALDSDRYRTLVDDLHQIEAAPPLAPGVDPDAPAGPPASEATLRALRRVRQAVRALPDHDPEAEALHEVRKRAKRARYAAELVSELSGGRTDKLAQRLTELQDVLGAHQDQVVLRSWLLALPIDELDPRTAFTAGRLAQALSVDGPPPVWAEAWQAAWGLRDRARFA
jgi:CHAD domain-containing protein